MAHRTSQKGMSLIEMMTVVAILGILSSTAALEFTVEKKRSKRIEVTLGLEKLREAQYVHYLEKGVYAGSFDDLLFATNEGSQVSATVYQGGKYQYTLSQPWGTDSYYIVASGNLDGDAFLDVWVAEAGRK